MAAAAAVGGMVVEAVGGSGIETADIAVVVVEAGEAAFAAGEAVAADGMEVVTTTVHRTLWWSLEHFCTTARARWSTR